MTLPLGIHPFDAEFLQASWRAYAYQSEPLSATSQKWRLRLLHPRQRLQADPVFTAFAT